MFPGSFNRNQQNFGLDNFFYKQKREPLKKIENSIIQTKDFKTKTYEKPEEIDPFVDSDDLFSEEEEYTEENIKENQSFHFTPLLIGDENDPQDATAYENIVYKEMRERECNYPECCVTVKINAEQRSYAIDWIDRIHFKTELTTSSLYQAFGIFDRAINKISIEPQDLLTYAAASLMIGSKIDDIYPVRARKIVRVSKEKLSEENIFKKEREILNAIGFDTIFPTPFFFLNYFLRISGRTQESMLFARFVMEICMTSKDFIDVKPSAIACVAIVYMRVVYEQEPWNDDLYAFTRYTLADLSEDIKNAYYIITSNDSNEAEFIRKKYCSDLFLSVGQFRIPDKIKELF